MLDGMRLAVEEEERSTMHTDHRSEAEEALGDFEDHLRDTAQL